MVLRCHRRYFNHAPAEISLKHLQATIRGKRSGNATQYIGPKTVTGRCLPFQTLAAKRWHSGVLVKAWPHHRLNVLMQIAGIQQLLNQKRRAARLMKRIDIFLAVGVNAG